MEFNEKIHVGATHEVHGAVTEENTAATVGSGSLAVNIIFLLIGSTDKFGTAILTYLFRPLFVSKSST